MLEIILLWVLGKKVAAIASNKGRSGTPYVLLLVLLWFCGEVGGVLAGIAVSQILVMNDDSEILVVIVGALIGAITGAVIAFVVVNSAIPAVRYDDEGFADDLDIRIR